MMALHAVPHPYAPRSAGAKPAYDVDIAPPNHINLREQS